MAERITTTVKWFDTEKGFGFINNPDRTGDIFVHYSSIMDKEGKFKHLNEGEQVSCLVVKSAKGWSASEVKRLHPPQHHSKIVTNISAPNNRSFQAHKKNFVPFMEAYDEPDFADGAHQALLEEGAADYNDMYGTAFNTLDMYHEYLNTITEEEIANG